MKFRVVLIVLLTLVMVLSLTSCSKSDYMIGEGSFDDVAKSFTWFFDTVTPSIFDAIGEAWHINSVIGFIIALLMSIVLFVAYVFLFILYFAIIIILAVVALALTLLGYLIYLCALIANLLFHFM